LIRELINSAIGGASFWVLTAPKRDIAGYRAVAQFLHFLGQPQQDAQRSVGTGYPSITHVGYVLLRKQDWFEHNAGTDLPVKQLTRGEVTDNSRGFHLGWMPEFHKIIEELCERALAGQQGAQQALDSAVERGNKVLRDFQKSVHT